MCTEPSYSQFSKGRAGKTTGSKRCLSCSPYPFPAAMQEGDWNKPLLCNDTCNLGKVGRRDGSQMEKTMRAEEEKVSHVHMLCLKVGLTDKKSGEQMFPQLHRNCCCTVFLKLLGGGVCVWAGGG